MDRKVNCIMLVDDSPDDNFFHERIIRKTNASDIVVIKETGDRAIEYLISTRNNANPLPDLIFLDINMPGMNGWEFLEEFEKLEEELQSKMIVVMLTTSVNPEDEAKARNSKWLADFKTKPLTREIIEDVLERFHSSS